MSADDPKPDNEIMETARAARRHAESTAHTPEPGRPRHWNAAAISVGVGVGIGSAALAAALLYTNRGKPKK